MFSAEGRIRKSEGKRTNPKEFCQQTPSKLYPVFQWKPGHGLAMTGSFGWRISVAHEPLICQHRHFAQNGDTGDAILMGNLGDLGDLVGKLAVNLQTNPANLDESQKLPTPC